MVKSTVPPGTTEKWNEKYSCIHTVFNPEFLTEANSFEDFKNQSRIIIGGPRPATGKVKQMFRRAFPTIPIVKTGTKTVPDYQAIDQSKLVPLLVKTIQELEARITALESE